MKKTACILVLSVFLLCCKKNNTGNGSRLTGFQDSVGILNFLYSNNQISEAYYVSLGDTLVSALFTYPGAGDIRFHSASGSRTGEVLLNASNLPRRFTLLGADSIPGFSRELFFPKVFSNATVSAFQHFAVGLTLDNDNKIIKESDGETVNVNFLYSH